VSAEENEEKNRLLSSLGLPEIAGCIPAFKEKYPEGMDLEAFMHELGLEDTTTACMLFHAIEYVRMFCEFTMKYGPQW
jgi:hypothetical protein